jgi:K+-transporting ATPase KdpF subunit
MKTIKHFNLRLPLKIPAFFRCRGEALREKISAFNQSNICRNASPLENSWKSAIAVIQKQGKKHLFPLSLFLWLSSNLLLSPMIYAATGQEISRTTAWAIGLLLLVTIVMAIYLLVVIFQPERF